MNDRTRGGLGIGEQDKKPDGGNPDFTDFKPRSQPHAAPVEPAGRSAQETGFTTRHATPAQPKVDGRSLRSTNRTTQLNIAVSPETKERFWSLAQAAGVQTGEDFLKRLMDGFMGGE